MTILRYQASRLKDYLTTPKELLSTFRKLRDSESLSSKKVGRRMLLSAFRRVSNMFLHNGITSM